MAALDPLAALVNPPEVGALEQTVFRGVLSGWNTTTGENVVAAGGATYTNIPFINSSLISNGGVLLISTEGGPIILGMLRFPTP